MPQGWLQTWLDYVVLAAILWGVVSGFWQGLIRVLFGLLALLLGVAGAALATSPVTAWLNARFAWEEALATWVMPRLPLPQAVLVLPVGGKVPYTWGAGLPEALRKALQMRAEESFAQGGTPTLGALLAQAAAELLFSLAVFFVLWLVIQTLVTAVGRLLAGWVKARGLTLFDRLGGAVAGAAKNAFVAGVVLAAALPFLVLLRQGQGLTSPGAPVPPGSLVSPGSLAATLAGWFGPLYARFLNHL